MSLLDRAVSRARDSAALAAPGMPPLRWVPWAAAALAVAARVRYVGLPATPDEGGFLLLGSQWSPGTSLYGDHWVDRPPLLIAIHAVAAEAGGVVALRLIGLLVVATTVLLTAALTRAALAGRDEDGDRWLCVVPTLAVACLLANPMLGASEVSGELLYLPFVLAGLLAVVRAWTTPTRRSALIWSFVAGAAAAWAVSVKQNAVDVPVVAVVLVLGRMVAGDRRRARHVVAGGALGLVVAGGLVLALALARGTDLSALAEALGPFRARAAEVIARYSGGVEHARAARLVGAGVLTALPLLAALSLLRVRRAVPAPSPTGPPARTGRTGRTGRPGRTAPDLRWPALALLAWELFVVAAGGSFWLHYLLVLVPGSALLAVAAAQRPAPSTERALLAWRRASAGVIASMAISGLAGIVTTDGIGPVREADIAVSERLRALAEPGDTAVVAFGHPDILWETGMRSPYEHLWSLPVRVRDAHLADFERVLRSGDAPTWVVVRGSSLGGWALHAADADRVLRAGYRPAGAVGEWRLWHRLDRNDGPDQPAG